MNKSNFFSLSFLTGAVALLLPGMAQKCQAQADFDNCLPPKVIHHFGFEDAVKDDFADDTLTIDGRGASTTHASSAIPSSAFPRAARPCRFVPASPTANQPVCSSSIPSTERDLPSRSFIRASTV